MFSSVVIVIILFLFLLFFMFYKRDMLIKMFSIDVTSSANRFQEQLEQTADIVIKRLEEQIIHLEYLLEEANEKIAILDNKIHIVDKIFEEKEKEKSVLKLDSVNLVIDDPINIEDIARDESENANLVTKTSVDEKKIPTISIEKYKNIMGSDKRSSVVEMADLGYDITEIAQTTGISKGEIMLLLQLNKK